MTSFLCLLMAAVLDVPLIEIAPGSVPPEARPIHATLKPVSHEGAPALEAKFEVADWPQVMFRPGEGAWDWRAHAGLAVELYNPGTVTVDVSLRVDNPGADGSSHCNTVSGSVPPGERYTLSLRFNVGDNAVFWGMRGVPERGPVGTGPMLDLANIVAFQVFLPRPREPQTLLLLRTGLFGPGGPLDTLVPLPFIDRFGQYEHQTWPGKIAEETELRERAEAETKHLAAAPALAGRDAFGGWRDGPQLEATGWFRTTRLDGKWWLVTPEGHLFFSLGVDCVGTWERTFVEQREAWFEWLPEPDDPQFGGIYGRVGGVHSMAEAIGGEGRVFSFYQANLIRKFGENWPARWREQAHARLQAWGFNTLGNWSQGDVISQGPLPYVVSANISGVPPIQAATGYWSKMMDVYHPEFAPAVDRAVAAVTRHHREQARCIGYFFDNELAWEGIQAGVLNSPAEQPARQRLIARLQEQYAEFGALCSAWGVEAESWETLRHPENPNAAATRDLDAFLYSFARHYFETIRESLRQHAPNQLYLGCRFSTAPAPAVDACADVADVLSYNLYYRDIPCDKFRDIVRGRVPLMIGEFHFGALDRGMFHTGLVATRDQEERAASYQRYVRSVADCPDFVGCHWFQFVDQPKTGRTYDGENYNIGFIDVTDTPYPELVEAARAVHGEIYERRHGMPAP